MDAWLVALIGIQMAFTVAIIAIVFKHYNARAQRKAELQARILDKFESPRDLSQFLESSEGKNLVSFLAPARGIPDRLSFQERNRHPFCFFSVSDLPSWDFTSTTKGY